jgi:hypothetical protein
VIAGVRGFDGAGFARHRNDFDRFDALRDAGRSHDLLHFGQGDGFGFFAGVRFVRGGIRIFAKFESVKTSLAVFVVVAQDAAHGFFLGTFADRSGFARRNEFRDTFFHGRLFLHNDFFIGDREDGVLFSALRRSFRESNTANGVS